MHCSLFLPALAVLLLGAAPRQDLWDRDARERVQLAVSHDGREGVRIERLATAGVMGEEGVRTVPVWLEAGRTYLIVGVCDDDCTDLDVRVFDTLGRAVASDEDPRAQPMVDFIPRRSGAHAVRTSMVTCRQTICRYAVAVLVSDAR